MSPSEQPISDGGDRPVTDTVLINTTTTTSTTAVSGGNGESYKMSGVSSEEVNILIN